ncbi:hypothetical protein [Micromonospora sp. CA-248212]|uniref:hypothetical protein n=1 Tax=Micromonospora sp. CA-248212 TaxID=3239961 RepID=UPI003D91F850
MTVDGRGPIETATAELVEWLTGAAGEPVPIGPPRAGGDADGLTLWPLELRPAQQTRSSGAVREPYRFTVRYLLSVAGPAGLAVLDRVLAATTRDGRYPVVLEAGAAALWHALDAAPRPALLIDVPAQVDHPTPAAPRSCSRCGCVRSRCARSPAGSSARRTSPSPPCASRCPARRPRPAPGPTAGS